MGEKILYLGREYYPATGGAEITDQILLESWVGRGGQARAIYFGSSAEPNHRGVELSPVSNLIAMKEAALSYKPDLVYSQIGTHGVGLEIARKLGLPVMTYLHDARTLCPAPVQLGICNRQCDYCPFYWAEAAKLSRAKAILRQFDKILVPSRFLRDLATHVLGRADFAVLYPAVRPAIRTSEQSRLAISMSGAEPFKGAPLFLEIAARMPDMPFLLAGRGSPTTCGYDAKRHPNVKVAGMLPMEEFYSQSWLVLMPSQMAESFGRMAPEAQSAGVLFMGSRIGGIPEAAGTAGILVDDYGNVNAWVKAIRDLVGDPGLQQKMRCMGLDHWRQFEAVEISGRFCGMVEETIKEAVHRVDPPFIPVAGGTEPFRVAEWLRLLFYGFLVISSLASSLALCGVSKQINLVPSWVLVLILLVLWGVHAGPLLQMGARPARHSGQNLTTLSVIFVLLLPLGVFQYSRLVPWVALIGSIVLILASIRHRRSARRVKSFD
jgi:glycosyltransferase involved in cell wall biosynthesis